MHARILRYLDEVVRCGSFRKAALHLHVAPTAVNRQILLLEEELGAPVFERIGNRLKLTPLGEMVVAHARQTLREHRTLLGRIAEHRGMRTGAASLAVTAGLAGSLLPSLMHEFRQRHAGIQIRVQDLTINEIVKAVEGGSVDLGLAYDLPDLPAFRTLAASDWPLGVAVPPNHPLAQVDAVTLDECVGYPLILPTPNMSIREMLDQAFSRAAIEVSPAVETSSIALIAQLVAMGSGIALLNPLDVIEDRQRGMLTWLPLADEGLPLQTLRLVARSRSPLTGAAELLAEHVASGLAARFENLRSGVRDNMHDSPSDNLHDSPSDNPR